MPWESILGGATGGVAVAIVIGVLFLKSLTEKVISAAEKRFEFALKRAEEIHKTTLAMATTIDTNLRDQRIKPYSELWKKTGVLPQWPPNRELTYHDLETLTGELRKWYFETGGMYLSKSARKAYGDVQEMIASVLEKGKQGRVSPTEKVSPEYENIRLKCSTLRTELTEDLLSRREAPNLSGAGLGETGS